MSDSIPSAHADADTEHQQLPANPEDRKAAAALSALNATEIGPGSTPKQSTSTADQEALGKAMSRLEIAAGQGGAAKTKTGEAQKEVVKKKAVRVAAEDVNLLVGRSVTESWVFRWIGMLIAVG